MIGLRPPVENLGPSRVVRPWHKWGPWPALAAGHVALTTLVVVGSHALGLA